MGGRTSRVLEGWDEVMKRWSMLHKVEEMHRPRKDKGASSEKGGLCVRGQVDCGR